VGFVLKILALKFKYLGDVAIMVPALRALNERWPSAQLDVLVANEAVPILSELPWVHKVWGFHRSRGSASIRSSLPLILALRKQNFDRSVDFVGNDRGAILSWCIGAQRRLGPKVPLGFAGRSLCYTQTIPEAPREWNEVRRDLHVLSAWDVPAPSSIDHEVHAAQFLEEAAAKVLPEANVILAHISASRSKKEWHLGGWIETARRAEAANIPIVFSSGTTERERKQLAVLKTLAPAIRILEPTESLDLFLAIIKRVRVFVSGDTGPLHFATGLGVPSIGIFGPTLPSEWAPLGPSCSTVAGGSCTCSGHAFECSSASPCIGQVTPAAVWQQIERAYSRASR
jgi:ADP-heptose:LPS heptosyltransferase